VTDDRRTGYATGKCVEMGELACAAKASPPNEKTASDCTIRRVVE